MSERVSEAPEAEEVVPEVKKVPGTGTHEDDPEFNTDALSPSATRPATGLKPDAGSHEDTAQVPESPAPAVPAAPADAAPAE